MALLRMTHLLFLKLLLLPEKYIISIFLLCVCVLFTLLQLICLFSSLSPSKTIPVLLYFLFFHSHPWGYNKQLSLCMVRLATSPQLFENELSDNFSHSL